MLQKDDLARLLDYTTWADHRALRAAAALTAAEFKRDLGASHGGVRGTLTHMLSGEWAWLERAKGLAAPRALDESEFPDVIALKARWRALEQHRQAWFDDLRESDLAASVRYPSGRATLEAPLWQLLQHLANHSTYHRGQVAALLRQLGTKPISSDMVAWDRERAATRGRAESG